MLDAETELEVQKHCWEVEPVKIKGYVGGGIVEGKHSDCSAEHNF